MYTLEYFKAWTGVIGIGTHGIHSPTGRTTHGWAHFGREMEHLATPELRGCGREKGTRKEKGKARCELRKNGWMASLVEEFATSKRVRPIVTLPEWAKRRVGTALGGV